MNDTHTMSGTTEKPEPDLPATERSPRWRFILRPLLIGMIVICGLLAVLTPSPRYFRRLAQQEECMRNLKVIGLALHNYHDSYKKFPWAITYGTDGTPMHSWRVRIMPFIRSTAFYDAYDFHEPWNGPKNRLLGDEIPDTWLNRDGRSVRRNDDGTVFKEVFFPPVYRCPSAPRSQNPLCTNYVMLIDDRPGKGNGPPNRPGSTPPSLDPESAVIVIEIADSDIHWDETARRAAERVEHEGQRPLQTHPVQLPRWCLRAARGRVGGIAR